jgi:hypothetical protein
MNRKQRRAAEHQTRKLARKAGFVSPEPESPLADVPEPGAPFPSLESISPARLAANRANAQLSTGPVSDSGKAIVSRNRLTHGLARHNGHFQLLPSEDQNDFATLKAALVAEHQPQTETESILVQSMAESHWLSNRAQSLQDSCFDPETGQIYDDKKFSLYLRYQTTHTRAFHKSLNDLLKLRKERRTAEIGFEAQRIQTEKHQMKKDHHYWDVLRKDAQACHQIAQNTMQRLQASEQHPGFEAQFTADLAAHNLKQANFQVATTQIGG